MNEPTMTQQDAWTFLSGGSESGSMKHEEAKAALQWHLQQETNASALKWAKLAALGSALSGLVALVAVVT
jgi:hypothetical protein